LPTTECNIVTSSASAGLNGGNIPVSRQTKRDLPTPGGKLSKDDDQQQRQFQEHAMPCLDLSDQKDLAYFVEWTTFWR
jgi:hypothetical protein